MNVPSHAMSDGKIRAGQVYRFLRDSHMVGRNRDDKLGPKASLRRAEDQARAGMNNLVRQAELETPLAVRQRMARKPARGGDWYY